MLMGDLLTAVQEKIPIKVVVFNNGTLGFVELEMKTEGLLDAFTGLENPNFAKVAEAIGFHARRVEHADGKRLARATWPSAPRCCRKSHGAGHAAAHRDRAGVRHGALFGQSHS